MCFSTFDLCLLREMWPLRTDPAAAFQITCWISTRDSFIFYWSSAGLHSETWALRGLDCEIIPFFCVLKRESYRKCCVGSMAPSVQRRRDACTRWPRMSSTFWAVLLLTALLLLYCGKSRTVTAPRRASTPKPRNSPSRSGYWCSQWSAAALFSSSELPPRPLPSLSPGGTVRSDQFFCLCTKNCHENTLLHFYFLMLSV